MTDFQIIGALVSCLVNNTIKNNMIYMDIFNHCSLNVTLEMFISDLISIPEKEDVISLKGICYNSK